MANPIVDKFKIDNATYDVQDTQARADIAKKIDINTTGDLNQTVNGNLNQSVTGNMKVTADGYVGISQGGTDAFVANDSRMDIGSASRRSLPLNLYGEPNFDSLVPTEIDDNYSYVEMGTRQGNKKFLISNNGAIPQIIPESPIDIRTYQTLKMDGTDDITATINTHTKNEPLFIPAGTYKVSAPLQLKHSLYGAGSSRDPARGTSDTILQYTANPTAFGSQGVITVSGDDVTGNIVIANLDISCNGMIGGIVFTTNKYTDNSITM